MRRRQTSSGQGERRTADASPDATERNPCTADAPLAGASCPRRNVGSAAPPAWIHLCSLRRELYSIQTATRFVAAHVLLAVDAERFELHRLAVRRKSQVLDWSAPAAGRRVRLPIVVLCLRVSHLALRAASASGKVCLQERKWSIPQVDSSAAAGRRTSCGSEGCALSCTAVRKTVPVGPLRRRWPSWTAAGHGLRCAHEFPRLGALRGEPINCSYPVFRWSCSRGPIFAEM